MSKQTAMNAQQPQELATSILDAVTGGVKLENVQITSYQLGVLDNNAPLTVDPSNPNIVYVGGSRRFP